MSAADADRLQRAAQALAEGQGAEVRRLFDEAPVDDDTSRARWVLLLAEAGEPNLARTLAEQIADPARRAPLIALLAAAPTLPRDESDDEDEALDRLEVRPVTSEPDDAGLVRAFARFFGGRPDLYAEQWFDAKRGRGGYRPVREPFTDAVARAHLSGRRTLGQYLLWPDDTVSFAVIDLDLSASALAELDAGHGTGSAVRHPALRAYASRLRDVAARFGLPLTLEDSGHRGLHLWLFFDPRRPARAARLLLGRLVDIAGPPPADVSIEIFPKQDRPGQRGLSSLVKLPLGIHRATLAACPLLDESFEPIADRRAALASLRFADPARIDAILGRRLSALPPLSKPGPARSAPKLPTARSPRTLAQALRAVPDGPDARRAAERMITGCDILRALVDRAYSSEKLTPDQARALIYSVGLVGEQGGLCTEILTAGGMPMRELHRARRGLTSPVGCRRLQALGVGACEGCPRGQAAEPYPTPALFAVGPVPKAPPRHAPFAAWLEPADQLASDAVEQLADEITQLETRLRRLEREEP